MFLSVVGPYSQVQSYLKQAKLLTELEQMTEKFNILASKLMNRYCLARSERKVSHRRLTVASVLNKYQNCSQLLGYILQWLINLGIPRNRISRDIWCVLCNICAKIGELHNATKYPGEIKQIEKIFVL